MIVFFDNCKDTIRTLPLVQHDSARVEDVDTNSEDHAVDCLRYACASRPWVKAVEKPDQPVRGLEVVTLNQLWKRQGQLKGNRL
jgi:hypothetical protein